MNIIWYIIWNIYCCLGGIEHFQMPENLEALERRKIAYIGIGVLTTNIFWFKDENKIVPCRAENFGWNKKTLLHIKAFFFISSYVQYRVALIPCLHYKAYLLLKWMLIEYNLAVLYFVVYPLLWFFFSLLTGRKRLFSAKCATSF